MATQRGEGFQRRYEIGSLLRYGYAGILASFLLALINKDLVKDLGTALGPVLSPLVVLGIGASLFVTYRWTIGEALYILMHFVHEKLFDRFSPKNAPLNTTSLAILAKKLGTPKGRMREAYVHILFNFLPRDDRERFDRFHAELHTVYLTGVMLASCWPAVKGFGISVKGPLPPDYVWVLSLASLLFLALAIWSDIQLHALEFWEVIRMAAKPAEEIRSNLETWGVKIVEHGPSMETSKNNIKKFLEARAFIEETTSPV